MIPRDLLFALLLPLPPWLGFWVIRLKGRVGLSYGYFLGGILVLLAMPWSALNSRAIPSAQLGGALFGFSLFLQAQREGRSGVRRMAVGVGGATLFAWAVGATAEVPMGSLLLFWGTGILTALVWLGFSDLGYRVAKGKFLELRLPLVGALTFLLTTILHRFLPLGGAVFSWPSSIVAGALLGLVALQQLRWLRSQGEWVEGRGDGFRVALSALESDLPPDQPTLSYRIEAQQPILLLDARGLIFEANEAFAREVGLQRHQIRGFELEAVFQGRDRSVWENLRQQLLRDSHGSATASLVRADGTYREAALEAVAFDKNMALLWISDPAPGTLAVRSTGQGGVLRDGGYNREALVNALGSLLPATDQLVRSAPDGGLLSTAGIVRAASLRISALLGSPMETEARPTLPSPGALEDLLPSLRRMLEPDHEVELAAYACDLLLSEESLERIVVQLLLHARQGSRKGRLSLRLDPIELGGRTWALLQVLPSGGSEPSAFLGLSWLQQQVALARGMLELAGAEGTLHPVVYLPLSDRGERPDPAPLAGRSVWIVDRDPLIREALAALVRACSGTVEAFPGLPELLRRSRAGSPAELLVLERTGRLDRFHRSLKRMKAAPPPTLILGNGEPIPAGSLAGPGRLGFLEKPFFGPEFIQSLLALLNPGHGRG